MIPKQQRVLCRAAFVLLCLLPTFIHLWSLITSSASQDSTNKLANDDSIQEESTETSKKIGTGKMGVPEFPWARQQGLDLSQSHVRGQVSIQKGDLPPSHWLRKISSATFSISESPAAVILEFPELTASRSAIQNLQSELVEGGFDSIFPSQGKLTVKIAKLTLRRFDDSQLSRVHIRDLELHFEESGNSIVIVGRRIPDHESESHLSPEYPFRFTATWTKAKTTIQLSGVSFPIWLLGNGYSDIVGESAELNGELRSIQFPNRAPSVRFAGRINDASCQSLSAWLNPSLVPLATGTCQITCEKFLTDEKRVREFVGEVQSIASGTIDPSIAKLLGTQARWAAATTGSATYRSFLFDVQFLNDQIQVKSKYEGKQLVWNDDGAGILLAE